MRIVSIGGGPAGLFFAILARKAFPESRITVLERNRPDDTFGWGVVFSRETLSNIAAADPESYAEIERSFAFWDDIETYFGGTCVTSTGHGFCGLARKRLLAILQERARGLGVEVRFETEVTDPESVRDADLVLGADGVNSLVRAKYADTFRPEIHQGRARFCWLGTTLPLRAFTFVFRESEHGLFQVHAYPFQEDLSTWIVECSEAAWRRAGLDRATEEETVAFCERLFREDLRGHPLLANRSIWRSFPTIRCASWSHGNVVLMGDAVHTAHFSIGSGTKLAMEDSMALVEAFRRHGWDDVPRVLAAYEAERRGEVERLQRAAKVSREWFEDCERWTRQHPVQFSFNLMTRSKRITYDNLAQRDPAFVGAVRDWFATSAGAPRASDGRSPPPAFTPFRLRGLTLPNRIVVSPMCQYSAVDGTPGDWHLVHLGSRAIGGAGLVISEMTDVTPEGRITPGCAGMYSDAHVAAWKRITDFVHGHSASKVGIQLAHAGRKASCNLPWVSGGGPLAKGGWPTLAPSAIPFDRGWHVPKEMDRRDMDAVRDAFVRATERSVAAGFDLVELHMAHGYLLSEFLSPLSNRRTDEYGGPLANRLRYPLEVLAAVRKAWPEDRPLAVRISAFDWTDGGTTPEESVEIARALRDAGCDVVDVSTGGVVADAKVDYGRMYQVPFADRIRHEAGVPVMSVGAILDADHANTVIAAGRADLAVLARPHLADPYLAAHAAARYGFPDVAWPVQYAAGKPRPA